MRKLIFTALASAAVLAIAPASALAHHREHGARHAREHHARRHERVRVRHFGSRDVNRTGTSSAPSGDSAGKVSSFTGGVLTITLNDGSQVSGKVTDATDCSTAMSSGDRSGSGDQSSGSGDQPSGSGDQQSGSGDQQSGSDDQQSGSGDQQSGDDQRGDRGDDDRAQACTSSQLTPGAVVRAATLKVSDLGAIWDKLELAQ